MSEVINRDSVWQFAQADVARLKDFFNDRTRGTGLLNGYNQRFVETAISDDGNEAFLTSENIPFYTTRKEFQKIYVDTQRTMADKIRELRRKNMRMECASVHVEEDYAAHSFKIKAFVKI